MIRKLTLAAGFAAGYVLGAKAGTQRYQQIVSKANELMGKPAVQDVASNLSSTAAALGDTAKAKVNETVSSVGEKVSGSGSGASSDVVDLSSSKTGARTGPMPGAAPSSTAPDIAGV